MPPTDENPRAPFPADAGDGRRRPDDRLIALALFAATFVIYRLTQYPGVGGRVEYGDAAKWQYIGSILGVSHPPGSPLYVLVTFVWGKLPLAADLWRRTESFSSVCGAGAVTCLFLLLRRVGLSTAPSLLGSAALAFSRSVWIFSTEAEVYSLLALFWTFVLHRFVVWSRERRYRDFCIACAAYAVGFGDHYMMLTMLPALFLLVFWVDRREALRARSILAVAASITAGLLPFAWMWHRMGDAPYSELAGPRGVGTFVDFILTRQYRGEMFNVTTRALFTERLPWAWGQLSSNVGAPVLLASLAGAISLFFADRRSAAFLVAATLGPLVFWVYYPIGDELGFAVPVLVGVAAFYAGAADLLVTRASRRPTLRWAAIAVAAALLVPRLHAAAVEFSHDRQSPLAHLTNPLDGVKEYRWDVACVIRQAEKGAVIIVPYGDYGSRQIVSYHRFANPLVRVKGLRFEYLFDPAKDWAWAPRRWHPAPSKAPIVYAYDKAQGDELARSGYTVGEQDLDLRLCGTDAGPIRFFRAEAPKGDRP